MNYKDRWETNAEGERFVFTVEMQRALVAQGLPPEPDYLAELNVESAQRSGRGQSGPPRQSRAESPRAERGHGGRDASRERQESPQQAFEEPETIQIDPMTGKYLGRLKWYNAGRGYGFIARGGGEDIFFHKSDVAVDPAEIAEGTWVLYDVEETNKGLEANEVEVYEDVEESE